MPQAAMTYTCSQRLDRYEIIILWSDDINAFVADVPALAACMAHGDSHEAALSAVKEAAALWLETAQATGRMVTQPRGARPRFA